MRVWRKVLTVLVIVLPLLAAVLWVGGEMHYRNCVDTAKATADTRSKTDRLLDEYNEFRGDDPRATRVQARIDGCSRVPF